MAVAANLRDFYTGGQLPGDANAVGEQAIQKPKPWPLIGGAAGAALVMFLVGYGCGNISVGRGRFNETTDQAVKVRDEVEKIQKQVAGVAGALKEIKLSEKEPPNFEAVKKLADLDFKEPDLTRNVFHTNYFDFEPETVRALFSYYNDVVVLSKQITEHSAKTLKDREAIEKYAKATAARQDKTLGVILDYSQAFPQSQLVELGQLVCPNPGQTDCPPADAKFKYRTSTGGEFSLRPLKGKPEASVFPMSPTDLQRQVISGDPNQISFRQFAARHIAILDTMRRLSEEEKQLLGNLKKRAEQAKLFTLF